MATYQIVRFYSPHDGRPNRVIKTVYSLEEAQAHTNDPRTRKEGVYFDGYRKVEQKRHYTKKEYGRIQAKHGFHGTITRPTQILVAEDGRPEHVDIYASRRTHRSSYRSGGIKLPTMKGVGMNIKISKVKMGGTIGMKGIKMPRLF